MLRAVIFDFDGVIADAEPLHYMGFRTVLAEEGIALSEEDYYRFYLAYDDKTCFREVLRSEGREFDESYILGLVERKARVYWDSVEDGITIFPGVPELLSKLSLQYPLAIGSGARMEEIEFILQYSGLRGFFSVIVSADEVSACKPDPETYIKALAGLNAFLSQRDGGSHSPIDPQNCLVIEDSVHGVEAAIRAGMKCVAVTNSYTEGELARAHKIVGSLEELDEGELESLFRG